MILLPDIEFIIEGQRHVLSIQDPYTLDGYLITNIEDRASYVINFSGIRIENENNYNVVLGLEEINYYFRREMDHFISRYGSDAHVEGRINIFDWRNYTFNRYLNEIKEQCDNISRRLGISYYDGINSYINSLKLDIRRQGREYFEPNRINGNRSDRYIIDNPYRDMFGYNMADFTDALRNFSNVFINFDSSNSSNKYIHDYNYKPKYIPNYMANEDINTTLLLGAEIEVDCGGKSEEHAKKVLEIICGTDPNNTDKALEDKIYCMGDGSLTNGLEFATMPCSLEYHKNKMKYKEMFEYLDKNGYKAHDTTTCGLHIHANRYYLGKTELVQQLTISKILYILEKFNDEICVIARRNNKYSQFVGAGKNETSIVELYGKYKNKDKYVALNLKHTDTIEFRCFKGTLKYETFILTLEFVKDIIDYAKSINIEQIELIKWDDLMNTFSDELKTYYNDRLEKENKKKEENKNITIDENIASARDAYTFFNSPISLNRECFTVQSSLLRLSNDLRLNVPNNRTTEENLKNKIKSLKKQIKNSNNYLEKKNFQKELNESQKELKKEKKKNKLSNNINASTSEN